MPVEQIQGTLLHHAEPVLGLGLSARADDVKNDPTGTWKWEVEIGGQKRAQTLKLELKDGKLTGAMIGMNRPSSMTNPAAISH